VAQQEGGPCGNFLSYYTCNLPHLRIESSRGSDNHYYPCGF
jgi:hypothetical protein